MSPLFIEFMIVAILSLVITFVLFRWLDSRADAESPILGGAIKYGGALAGFVLVFWLLSYIYDSFFESKAKTGIQLDGEYDIYVSELNRLTRIGTATVDQMLGDSEFYIVGEIEARPQTPAISFHTVSGVIRESRLVWLFENDRREMGIGLGDVRSDDKFVMTCGDVLGNEVDAGIEGRLVFTRNGKSSEANMKGDAPLLYAQY